MSKIENYAEYIASLPVSNNIPNEITIAAMKEAESGIDAGTVDTSSMEAFLKSMEDTPD